VFGVRAAQGGRGSGMKGLRLVLLGLAGFAGMIALGWLRELWR
jgi:hypothetical protein